MEQHSLPNYEVCHASELCGELSTGEYHAQYERSSGWVWTGGLEARQGVGTQDWGSPLYHLETKQ